MGQGETMSVSDRVKKVLVRIYFAIAGLLAVIWIIWTFLITPLLDSLEARRMAEVAYPAGSESWLKAASFWEQLSRVIEINAPILPQMACTFAAIVFAGFVFLTISISIFKWAVTDGRMRATREPDTYRTRALKEKGIEARIIELNAGEENKSRRDIFIFGSTLFAALVFISLLVLLAISLKEDHSTKAGIIDDETATRYYNEFDSITDPVLKEQRRAEMIAWADAKDRQIQEDNARHFERVYTDDGYFRELAKNPQVQKAARLSPAPDLVKYGSANRAYFDYIRGRDLTEEEYQIERSAYLKDRFGKSGAEVSEGELFRLIRSEYERSKAIQDTSK